MDILNGIGLRPDGTLRYVTKNIPGRVEWWEIREARWIGMKRMKGPNRGTSSGCLRDRSSEDESRSLWLLTGVPL
jgi:hypothetical protein